MMNWFWRWLDDKMAKALQEKKINPTNTAWNDEPQKFGGRLSGIQVANTLATIKKGIPEVESESPLTFTVHHANGGIIIQQVSYNRQGDDRKVRLHLVHENADIAKEIGDIVALELIRKQ